MVMTPEYMKHKLVAVAERDVAPIKALEQFICAKQCPVQLVAPDGEQLDIPEPVYRALRQIIPIMAQGAAIGIIPLHKELTTQEAARLLNVSRPHVIKLLDDGVIPYTKVGTHRRILFSDVMAYKERRSGERKAAMAEIIALGDELGDYD